MAEIFQTDVLEQYGWTVVQQEIIAKIVVYPMDVFHGGKHVVSGMAANVFQKVLYEMTIRVIWQSYF